MTDNTYKNYLGKTMEQAQLSKPDVLHIEPGIYDISNYDYHRSDAVSRSALMRIKQSPFHFWHQYINKTFVQKEDTQAMNIGNAVHTLLLEPDKFQKRYTIAEKMDKRTKEGKAQFAALMELAKGKTILTTDEYYLIKNMADAFMFDSEAKGLIEGGRMEKSLFWRDKATDILCKARPDIWHSNMIVDIKTTADASYRGFQSAMVKYGYHIQAAMIREALRNTTKQEINNFVFVAVEKEPPHAVAVYVLDGDAIEAGHATFINLLQKLKKSQQTNSWERYESQIMSLPGYAKEELLA